MRITVHGGAEEIGASCVEISPGGRRVFFDVGKPLDGSSQQLPECISDADAVFISHPHEDHFGLLDQVPGHVPVYIGRVGLDIMQAARVFRGLKPWARDFRYFKPWQPIQVGGLTVKPYPMDHSAVDSFSFLVSGENGSLFYSGDFRGHGRKGKLLDMLTEQPPARVDVLLMEGTTMGREPEAPKREQDIENEMVRLWKGASGLSFLICSGQNIDRLVSAYKACLRTGRTLVIDIYTAWLLEKMTGLSSRIPHMGWNNLRVLSRGRTAASQYVKVKENQTFFGLDFRQRLYRDDICITHEEISRKPGQYVIKTNWAYGLLDELEVEKVDVVYSMWPGYLKEEYNPRGSRALCSLRDDPRVDFHIIHTSGHAPLSDLQRLALALKPEIIIPIHTEHPGRYQEAFPDTRVHTMLNGESFDLVRAAQTGSVKSR